MPFLFWSKIICVYLNGMCRSGANLDVRDHMGRTPLWIAASKNGKLDFIKKLLEANANVNMADAEEKASPLQVSTMSGHLEIFHCSNQQDFENVFNKIKFVNLNVP